MADLEHLHPTFRQRVLNTGHRVNSGARRTCCGPGSQQYLYDNRNRPGFNAANPPGTSWHEYGKGIPGGEWAMAVDFAGPPYPHGAPGIIFPIRREPWHGQPSEIPETARVAGAENRLPRIDPPKRPDPPKPRDPWPDEFPVLIAAQGGT